MKRVMLFVSLLALAPAAQLSAQQPRPTVQQQFDAASAALLEQRWEEALRLFEALEARLTTNRRTLAVVRVRKASALIRLGRRDEAAAALLAGLPDLPAGDASLHEDRFLGLVTLGELAELSLDYADARRHYRAAKAVPVPDLLRLSVYRGLVQTEMFEDGPAALANADEALALVLGASTDRQHEGLFRTLRGRVLLNMGRIPEARAELRTAMQRLGGLTTRVNLADIVARSDLAIAAMLAGDEADARRYLAYTGAGHHETFFSPSAGRMAPPMCGNGLEPADVAVVEFSIRDDGSVGHATPIHSSRQGRNAVAFAQAALRWAWSPESFRDIPPLFRMAMRVEVRCSLRPPQPDHSLHRDIPEVGRWLAAHNIGPGLDSGAGPLSPAPPLRQELARLESQSGPWSAALLPTLIDLAMHPSVGAAETADYLRRALPLAAAERAPAPVIASLAVQLARQAHAARRRSARDDPPDFAEVLALPAVRDNEVAAAAVRLAQSHALFEWREDEAAAALLAEIRRAPAATADPWLRVGVLEMETAFAAATGDREGARAAYEAMGPAAEPCAVVPRARPTSTSNRDFPNDAMRWGFEGWVQVEARITREGDLAEPRTVLSYPPFVFDQSAERIVGRSRVDPVYFPEGQGCPANRTLVHFRIRN